MDFALVVLLISVAFIGLSGVLHLKTVIKRIDRSETKLRSLFIRPKPDEPSPVEDQLIEVAQVIGRVAASSLSGGLLAKKSALTRQGNALTGAIVEDQINENPLVAMAVEQFGGPELKKTLKKHPEWSSALMSMVQNGGLGNLFTSNGDNGNSGGRNDIMDRLR